MKANNQQHKNESNLEFTNSWKEDPEVNTRAIKTQPSSKYANMFEQSNIKVVDMSNHNT